MAKNDNGRKETNEPEIAEAEPKSTPSGTYSSQKDVRSLLPSNQAPRSFINTLPKVSSLALAISANAPAPGVPSGGYP